MKKLLRVKLLFIVFILSLWTCFADLTNKEWILNGLNWLKNSLEVLSNDKEEELTTKVYVLSTKYNNIFKDLWYSESTINSLISMWELDSNFKWDLVTEYSALKNDIISKINTELLLINNFIDDITLNYSTVSDTQFETFKIKVEQFESNLSDYTSLFTSRINNLLSKCDSNLTSSISSIKDLVDNNSDKLTLVNNFITKFDVFSNDVNDFTTNYNIFKETYLAYAWDITTFSNSKQNEYVDLLRTNLYKLIDKNLELNESLKVFETELKRYADILIENFSYKLYKDLNREYWLLYTESDVNSLISNFNNFKNKYFDAEWNPKALLILNEDWILTKINTFQENINEINSKVLALISNTDNSLDNIKIKLENQIITFYNDNYWDFKEDLSVKIKEKIWFIDLENKNAISIAESIDIRYEILAWKIKDEYNIFTIKNDVNDFKSKINKFNVISNDRLQLKIKNLNYTLDTFVLNKEIKHSDFSDYSTLIDKYKEALSWIFTKFVSKYWDKTSEKLNVVLDRVNKALDTNLSKKNKFMLLNVKLNIIEFLHTLD